MPFIVTLHFQPGLRRCILTNEFSPVRLEEPILAVPKVLTKSHIVVFFIKPLYYSLASSLLPRIGLVSHLKVSWQRVILYIYGKSLVSHLKVSRRTVILYIYGKTLV